MPRLPADAGCLDRARLRTREFHFEKAARYRAAFLFFARARVALLRCASGVLCLRVACLTLHLSVSSSLHSMTLSFLGWDDFFSHHFSPFSCDGLVPARVVAEHKHGFDVFSTAGALSAECTGKLLHAAATRADLPAVGDWVAVRPRPGETHADIHAVLPRRTKFSRRAAGASAVEQIL